MTDTNTTTATTETATKGKRGRKPGVVMDTYFVVGGLKGDQLVMEHVKANSATEAETQFKASHKGLKNITTLSGDGKGFRLVAVTKAKPAAGITVSADQLRRFTTLAFSAVYKQYKVYGNGMKAFEHGGVKYKDNEWVSITVGLPVDPTAKPRPEKPRIHQGELIRRADLENLVETKD